jgi:hypothetical protein
MIGVKRMQKWEYLVLSLVRSYGMNYRVNGEKVGDWKDLPIHDIFNKIGKQGFEYVSYDGENYIFKRPVVVTKTLSALPSLGNAKP